jgi:hypothetical protein
MAMKTILVPIPDTAVHTAAIEIALMVAKAVAGHVEGLYIETPAPVTPRSGFSAAVARRAGRRGQTAGWGTSGQVRMTALGHGCVNSR